MCSQHHNTHNHQRSALNKVQEMGHCDRVGNIYRSQIHSPHIRRNAYRTREMLLVTQKLQFSRLNLTRTSKLSLWIQARVGAEVRGENWSRK